MTVSIPETIAPGSVRDADDEAESCGRILSPEEDIAVARWLWGPDAQPDPLFDPAGDSRQQVIRWAVRHGLVLYRGLPGAKYPEKYHCDPGCDRECSPECTKRHQHHTCELCPERAKPEDKCRCFRFFMRGDDGSILFRLPSWMLVLDEDGSEAAPVVAGLSLPPHFAIRSRSSGGVKRILFLPGGVRRSIRPLAAEIPLDVLGNPDSRFIWVKIWDDAGYDVISTSQALPDCPESVLELLTSRGKDTAVSGKHHGGAASLNGSGDLPSTPQLVADGIPHGCQDDWLTKVALREARIQHLAGRALDEDQITGTLIAIARASEQDEDDPWLEAQLRGKARSAISFIRGEVEAEDAAAAAEPAMVDSPGGTRPLSRHAGIPRLRVAPPEELDRYADKIVTEAVTPIREAAEAARPEDTEAEDAEWGDLKAALDLVEPAARVLGGLGDLDLIDYGAARRVLSDAALPHKYLDELDGKTRGELEEDFGRRLISGWNTGAGEGHEVPAELRAALDSWHPPRPIPRKDVELHRLPPGRGGAWPVQNFLAQIDDRGNARRLLDHYGDRIRFVDGQKGLGEYAFDGQRWLDVPSGGPGLVAEFADQTIQVLPVTEAMSLSAAIEYVDKKGNLVSTRGRYWEWLNEQQSNARRAGMIAGAVAIPGMRVPVSVFDANPRWLNTPSGEIDQGRAEIDADGEWHCAEPVVFHAGQHYPEHFHSRITAAAYDPLAVCPEWERALKAWLGDDDLITYTGKLVAASVRGMTTLKVITLLLGGGDSGKSTFLEVLLTVLGSYAMTAQPSILRKGKGGGTLSDDLADLRGFRLVTTTETSGSEQMDEPRLKRMSGGDRLRARGMYQASGEWDPQFILWLATNFVPRLSGEDLALWRRFAPIMFPGRWTETGLAPDGRKCNRADPNLKKRLLAEAPGILNWIIRHLRLLYAEGLAEPKAVTAKRRELQGQQDTAGQFIAMAKAASNPASGIEAVSPRDPLLATGSPMRIRWTSLYRHYEAWATFGKINAVGKDAFKASLANHGHKFVKWSGAQMVTGFGHRESGVMAQCPVCEEMLPEPKKTKSRV